MTYRGPSTLTKGSALSINLTFNLLLSGSTDRYIDFFEKLLCESCCTCWENQGSV